MKYMLAKVWIIIILVNSFIDSSSIDSDNDDSSDNKAL